MRHPLAKALAPLTLCVALLLAGCAAPVPETGEAVWWQRAAIQCEETPWDAWARDTGWSDERDRAKDAFQNDGPRSRLLLAYYASVGVTLTDSRAYHDDMFYTTVCGAPSGWHYWIKGTEDFAGDGWQRSQAPPTVGP